MNYKKTAYTILQEKVNKSNIDEVLEEWNDFISHGGKNDRKERNPLITEVEKKLISIKKLKYEELVKKLRKINRIVF